MQKNLAKTVLKNPQNLHASASTIIPNNVERGIMLKYVLLEVYVFG